MALFQCMLGLQCNDFAMIAADRTINIQNILVFRDDEDKIYKLPNQILMGVNGNSGEVTEFVQFVDKNLELYEKKNGYPLDTAAVTHFTRKTLAESLHGGAPSNLNLMIAGYDEKHGGQLYFLDFLASCVRVPYSAHGFGGLLTLSILDYFHKPDLTVAEAYAIMRACVCEIHKRLFLHLSSFAVKIVSRDGVTLLPTIYATTL